MQIEVNVPDGKSGNCIIKSFEVSEENARSFNMLYQGTSSRYIQAGKYKKLIIDGEVMMSNTPAEIKDHAKLFNEVKKVGGSILINGLGLGMALTKILSFENVTDVTVIEISEDVIKLVADTFKDDKRVNIIHADALRWKAPKDKHYNIVWHDIWLHISSINTGTMGTLHRKYARKCDWQSSWVREEVQRLKRKEYNENRGWVW